MLLHLLTAMAVASPSATNEAFERLDELLTRRLEDGLLAREDIVPTMLVATKPLYEESAGDFQTRSLRVLLATLGEQVRVCEACAVPRTQVENGALVTQVGPIGLDEIRRLDEANRGDDPPARSAIWIEEYALGVSIRIVDVATARVIFAQNVDPQLKELDRTRRRYFLADELERRARRDGLTQLFVDVPVWPSQSVSVDWTDQFGKGNRHLAGFSLSLFQPIAGFGAAYHHVIPALGNTSIGGKVYFSLPIAVGSLFVDTSEIDLPDELITGLATVRVPVGRTNLGLVLQASTNGTVGAGISLLNFTLLPVIP